MALKVKKVDSPAKLLEKHITAAVKQYLQLRGWRGIRMQRTVVPGQFQSGEPGMPDYLFLHYKKRMMLWIEFKAPTGQIRPQQVEWIKMERLTGAVVAIVDDLDTFRSWYEHNYGIEGQTRLI